MVHKGITYPGEQEAIVDEELWTAVQARLAENRGTRRKARVETAALLSGLIFDDRGHIMSPTYSLRRGNRYRYYISSALLHDRKADAGSRTRVNADEMERLVVGVLSQELSRPELSTEDPTNGWSVATRVLVRDAVERVVVQSAHIQIIRKQMAASATAEETCDGPNVHVVPMPAPRPRARKEIVIPGGRDFERLAASTRPLSSPSPVPRFWMRDLRAGKYADTVEIARQFKFGDEHVRRVLRIGYLAPDIIEAIVEGRQPRSMTVKRLLQRVPCDWADQRAAFGFARS